MYRGSAGGVQGRVCCAGHSAFDAAAGRVLYLYIGWLNQPQLSASDDVTRRDALLGTREMDTVPVTKWILFFFQERGARLWIRNSSLRPSVVVVPFVSL